MFDDVIIALKWHHGTRNCVWSMASLSCYEVYFKFKGKSALAVVELMNVGANYLREHIILEAIYRMFSGEVSTEFPASVLRKHPNVVIVADKEEFSVLEHKTDTRMIIKI
ncbi:hypothetical protein V7167_15075 [Bacillus toyonensis]|uniref:hypothetical protein n=2 Tax=Bacillus TaxID=1386 RepID=UPI000BFC0714|nr:hypothetical protein [Bacillus toyonensis]PHD00258.1 hypothetical protein COF44_13585 [Bacillus toyonensis]